MLKFVKQGWLRIPVVFVIVVIALVVLVGGWGYTTLTVDNKSVLKVSKSEDALVGVKVMPVIIEHGSTGKCGVITNNMPRVVDITLLGDFCNYNSSLLPGKSTSFYKLISSEIPTGSYLYSGTVWARWDSGEAEIDLKVPVHVVEPPPSP